MRECMDAANGVVRVESKEGIGTTFKLTWDPAETVPNEEPRSQLSTAYVCCSLIPHSFILLSSVL